MSHEITPRSHKNPVFCAEWVEAHTVLSLTPAIALALSPALTHFPPGNILLCFLCCHCVPLLDSLETREPETPGGIHQA